MRRIPMSTVEPMMWIESNKSRIWLRISSPRRGGPDRSKSLGNMKKIVLVGVVALVVMSLTGIIAFRTISAKEELAGSGRAVEVSPKAAKSLQQKKDAIK